MKNLIFLFISSILLLPARGDSVAYLFIDGASDPRLAKKVVNLDLRQSSLAEVLPSLTKQTSINISVNTRAPYSSYPFCACCENTPVGKIVDAINRCLSVKGGEWSWQRVGVAPEFSYEYLA